MRRCRHKNIAHGIWANGTWDEWRGAANAVSSDRDRCCDCGTWLPLGPANDADPNVVLEVALASLLAQHELEFTSDALDEAYGITVDIFAAVDEPNPNLWPKNRPLSPIEIMVDHACGVDRDDDNPPAAIVAHGEEGA